MADEEKVLNTSKVDDLLGDDIGEDVGRASWKQSSWEIMNVR